MLNYSIYGDVGISNKEIDQKGEQRKSSPDVRTPVTTFPKAEPNLPGASVFPKDDMVPGKTPPSDNKK